MAEKNERYVAQMVSYVIVVCTVLGLFVSVVMGLTKG